ncbi:MAG: UbiX family flavin prenyltransferase [Thermoplasmata archaeon]
MKILLSISGASGVIYGKRLLEYLSERDDIDVDLIISDSARKLIEDELEVGVKDLSKLADDEFQPDDLESPPASGSVKYDAMAIVPCSMSSLSKISAGISDNLITRAAVVSIKEGRKLLLVPRETPLTTTWLENMRELSGEGVTILPSMPGFYTNPESIDDLVDFIAGKILDNLGIENSIYDRWK